MRLKKELATLRSILRSYVHEIDSLNRVNEQLRSENQQVKAQYTQATQTITNLSTEKGNAEREGGHRFPTGCHGHFHGRTEQAWEEGP